MLEEVSGIKEYTKRQRMWHKLLFFENKVLFGYELGLAFDLILLSMPPACGIVVWILNCSEYGCCRWRDQCHYTVYNAKMLIT